MASARAQAGRGAPTSGPILRKRRRTGDRETFQGRPGADCPGRGCRPGRAGRARQPEGEERARGASFRFASPRAAGRVPASFNPSRLRRVTQRRRRVRPGPSRFRVGAPAFRSDPGLISADSDSRTDSRFQVGHGWPSGCRRAKRWSPLTRRDSDGGRGRHGWGCPPRRAGGPAAAGANGLNRTMEQSRSCRGESSARGRGRRGRMARTCSELCGRPGPWNPGRRAAKSAPSQVGVCAVERARPGHGANRRPRVSPTRNRAPAARAGRGPCRLARPGPVILLRLLLLLSDPPAPSRPPPSSSHADAGGGGGGEGHGPGPKSSGSSSRMDARAGARGPGPYDARIYPSTQIHTLLHECPATRMPCDTNITPATRMYTLRHECPATRI